MYGGAAWLPLAFDDGDPLTEVCRLDRALLSRGTSAQNDQVEVVCHGDRGDLRLGQLDGPVDIGVGAWKRGIN